MESNYETSTSVDVKQLSEEEKMFIASAEDVKASDGDIGGAAVSHSLADMESAGSGPLFDESAPKLQFMEGSAIKLDDMTTSTELEDDDDLVIETVTLGQQEETGMNDSLISANDRFDNAAEFQAQPEQQQMQPPPEMPPQGQPPQQQRPGQPPQQY